MTAWKCWLWLAVSQVAKVNTIETKINYILPFTVSHFMMRL